MTPRRRGRARAAAQAALGAVLLLAAGCMGEPETYREHGGVAGGNPNVQPKVAGSFAPLNLFALGGGTGGGAGIGVNAFLWRASLDTVSFMPLVSADPFGGVIITDWYTPPASPYERFKMVVYILDTKLRADGVKVNVFREQLVGERDWKAAAVNADTGTELENAILTRARQLRIKALREP